MENQLLNIKINQDDLNAAIANAAKARTELDKLKATNKELEAQKKELMKADGDQSAAITKLNEQISKNNAEIKANSTTIRQNEKIVTDNTAAQNANKGSITQLREQLKIVSKQWADLSEEERENEEIGGKLAKQKLDLTNKLKEEEKATGDTRRNVGNYTESVQEALKHSGLFGGVIGKLEQAQYTYTAAMKGATFATSSFKKALISTGIGAIVVALGGLISFLTRTQEGMDKVSQAVSGVSTFVNVLLDALSNLGSQIIDSIIPTFKGLGSIIKGLVTFDIESIKNGFNQVKDAVSSIEPINIIEVGKEAAKAAKESARLTKEMQQIKVVEAELNVERAKSRALINQLRRDSQDENRSLEEREKLLRRAVSLEQDQLNRAIDLQKQRLENIKAQNALSTSTEEDLQKERDLEIQIAQLQEESLNKQIELEGQLRGIQAKREAERQKAIEEEQKAREKAIELKRQEEEQKAAIAAEFAELMAERERQRVEEERVKLQEQRAEGLISKQEYEDALLEIENQTIMKSLAFAELAKEEAIANTQLTENERQRIINESNAIILNSRKQLADQELKITQDKAKQEEDIEKKKTQSKQMLQQMAFQTFTEIAGKESVLGKAASVAQTSINTYEAASNALKNIPAPFNIPFAALTVAQGLLNVRKIVATPTPSFAQGGFTGDGYGLPDSSGYKPAGIVHEGEYVIKKSMVDNPAFSGIINTLERSRLRGYADGGFVSRSASLPATQGLQNSQLQNTLSELRNMQPIVKVTDINRVSGQAQMVRVSGELS